jgi:Tetratricopeptide repeat
MARNSVSRISRIITGFLLAGAVLSPAAETHWIRLKSPNFEMYSSAGSRSALDTIREFEQVRGFFLQAFGGQPAKPVPVRLVAFGSVKEYEPYKLNEYAIAYYHDTPDRDYIVMSHAGADTFPIAVHEYVHLVVRHAGLKLPPWLNEGLAELYSTLKPYGGKILVGDLIPGRHQALLREKWAPLSAILAADHDSPYYNEKDKAGSLYNEGWALTHMLAFRAEYRPKFGQLLRTISDGTDSATALEQVFGKTVPQIEKDLQGYLRGTTFQGTLVTAKLDKVADEIPVESLADFDTALMFADLMYRPGKEAEHRAALERLVEQDPKRSEPFRALGYLDLRAGHIPEGLQQFSKAYDLGNREPKMLWDYGRVLASRDGEKAAQVLSTLLSVEPERLDVRLDLADLQLRNDNAAGAILTLTPLKAITPEETARYFRIAVYADLQIGNREGAAAAARHFMDLAKTDPDRAAAELLMQATAPRSQTETVMTGADGPPTLRRRDAGSDAPVVTRSLRPPRPSAQGQFVELDCRGKEARMVVATAGGRKTFLIEDPLKVIITGQSDWQVDMTCGAQKNGPKVEVGYDPPAANQPGIDGLVRTLAFR